MHIQFLGGQKNYFQWMGGGDILLFLANALINTTIHCMAQVAVHQTKGLSHLAKPIHTYTIYRGRGIFFYGWEGGDSYLFLANAIYTVRHWLHFTRPKSFSHLQKLMKFLE